MVQKTTESYKFRTCYFKTRFKLLSIMICRLARQIQPNVHYDGSMVIVQMSKHFLELVQGMVKVGFRNSD